MHILTDGCSAYAKQRIQCDTTQGEKSLRKWEPVHIPISKLGLSDREPGCKALPIPIIWLAYGQKETAMAKTRIGKLRPRYSFILNPYSDLRLSRCPKCEKLTHLRKFALLIDIDGWGPMALGKTCRYCSRCELIMAHQDELEAQLVHSFSQIAPEVVGNEYLVLGTIDKKVWKEGLKGEGKPLVEMLKHVAEFKNVYNLEYQPAGWYPADEEPQK